MTEQERLDYEDTSEALKAVLSTPAGKRVLFWILSECSIYRSAYAGELAAATNFELGRQDVGRRIIQRMDEIDPRIYPQLLLDVADIREMERAARKAAGQTAENDDELD